MKNIMIINNALNCVYDVHMATNEEFEMLFLPNTNVTSLGSAMARNFESNCKNPISEIMFKIKLRRIPKVLVNGINGILYTDIDSKIFDLTVRPNYEEFNTSGDMIKMINWETQEYEFQKFYNPSDTKERMYNLLYIDGTVQNGNDVLPEVYACTKEEYKLLFPNNTDVTFLDEIDQVYKSKHGGNSQIGVTMSKIWNRRVPLSKVNSGIAGTFSYDRS